MRVLPVDGGGGPGGRLLPGAARWQWWWQQRKGSSVTWWPERTDSVREDRGLWRDWAYTGPWGARKMTEASRKRPLRGDERFSGRTRESAPTGSLASCAVTVVRRWLNAFPFTLGRPSARSTSAL